MSDILSPRIYVGAGGSGRRMVALIKQAVEADPHLSPAEKQAFQFLALDADAYQNDCKPLDPHSEYLHIAGFRPAPARQADYLAEAVRDWWIDSYTPPYIQQGAGAVRLIGRLCYYYHHPRIREAFQQAVQRATGYAAGRQVAGELTVYIIGSMAGGTGSSMFLDLAHLARTACNYRQVYVNGVIVLPDVFTVTQVLTQQKFKDRWMANGYAALKELFYFNEHPGEFKPLYRAAQGREHAVEHPRLFDQCFFIEPVLGSTSTVADDNDMFALAAESVYLFSASANGNGAASVLVNTDGIHYASLGMQSIVYPHEYAVRYAGHWGTARLLRQLLPQQTALEEERSAREQLTGDLQAAGWAHLDAMAAQALQQIPMPEPVEVDPEADLAGEVGRAIDRYKADLRPVQDRLAAWGAGWSRELPEYWETQVERLLAEGRSLGWTMAYLKSLADQLTGQIQRLEQEVKQQSHTQAQAETRLRNARAPHGIAALIGGRQKRAEFAEDLEDKLEQLYTEEIPQRWALEAAAGFARTFLSQWLQPRLHRYEQLRSAALEVEVHRQEEAARKVARELDEMEHRMPHTHFSIGGADLPKLVASALDRLDVGGAPLKAIWLWVSTDGTDESRPALMQELQAAVAAGARGALDLTLLESWERLSDPEQLEARFRAAAMTCRPFWSYIEEQAGEHLTRVSVLALPQEAAWDKWLSEMRIDLRRIEGDPHRVVFLTVEGCRSLKDVHLKELPLWFRTYEQVQRTYDMGLDERPLHIHRHWTGMPEVDDTLPVNVGRFFGPAEARGLITATADGYVLTVGGERIHLGSDCARAMQALVDLQEPAAGAFRDLMASVDRTELRELGYVGACQKLKAYADSFRAEGRLTGDRRARALQAEAYLQHLRQQMYGLGPESE